MEQFSKTTLLVQNDRQELVETVRRWGGIATDAILSPTCQIYRDPNIAGLIGYRLENNHAVVFGNPVCSPNDANTLAQSFDRYSKQQGWTTTYVSVTGRFAKWAFNNICGIRLEFGHEVYMDPHSDPRERTGENASLVRRKVRHAQNEGTSVQEYSDNDPQFEEALDEVGQKWLQGRKGPQVHISRVEIFEDRFGKRWFYAKQGEKLVGVLVLNRLEERDGWLMNHIMFTQDAPHGTPELLVVTTLAQLAQENCRYVSFGNVSKKDEWEIQGLGSFSTWCTQNIVKITRQFFRLDGHLKFWEKFHPEFEPSYVLLQDSSIKINHLLSLTRALNMHIKLPSIFNKNSG